MNTVSKSEKMKKNHHYLVSRIRFTLTDLLMKEVELVADCEDMNLAALTFDQAAEIANVPNRTRGTKTKMKLRFAHFVLKECLDFKS